MMSSEEAVRRVLMAVGAKLDHAGCTTGAAPTVNSERWPARVAGPRPRRLYAALARARDEQQALEGLMLSRGERHTLEAWDWRFYAEKVRQARYALDEAELAVELVNRVVAGFGGVRFGVHVCRGNWSTQEDVLLSGSYEALMRWNRNGTLVPGDGEGRNGVWLAAQGHAVLSVDASGVGLRKAQQWAAEQGVALQTELADLTMSINLASGDLVQLMPDWTRDSLPVHVVYPPNRHLSAKVRAFVDWAAELFASQPLLQGSPLPA